MRKAIWLAAILAACSLPSMTLAGPNLPSHLESSVIITPTAGGCGEGFHRGPMGGCVANGPVVVEPAPSAPGPRVIVGPRGGAIVCPPGYHLGPERRACWPN
jgi:hypothetical protein